MTSLGLNLSRQRTDGGDFVIKYFIGEMDAAKQESQRQSSYLHSYLKSGQSAQVSRPLSPKERSEVVYRCYISQQSFPVTNNLGFSGDPVVKNPPCNTGGTTSIPGLGRSHKYQGNQARARQLLSLSSGA